MHHFFFNLFEPKFETWTESDISPTLSTKKCQLAAQHCTKFSNMMAANVFFANAKNIRD